MVKIQTALDGKQVLAGDPLEAIIYLMVPRGEELKIISEIHSVMKPHMDISAVSRVWQNVG